MHMIALLFSSGHFLTTSFEHMKFKVWGREAALSKNRGSCVAVPLGSKGKGLAMSPFWSEG